MQDIQYSQQVPPQISNLEKVKIVIVGECPNETEVKEAKPFCGMSGRVLDEILREVGIDREQCYITNVVQVRPPSNNFGVFYEDKGQKKPTEYLSSCYRRLHEELTNINPNIIIAC